MFVPPTIVKESTPSPRKLDKAKRVLEPVKPQSRAQGKKDRGNLKHDAKGDNPSRNQPLKMSIPECFHCGEMGHIHAHCYYLRFEQHKKESPPPKVDLGELVLMVQDLNSRLDVLEVSSGVPRGSRSIPRRGATTHPVRGRAKRPT